MMAAVLLGSCPTFGQQLRSAAEPDYPPFSIVNPAGEADGLAVELLKATADAIGLTVEFKTAPWAQIKEELAKGELDVLPLVGISLLESLQIHALRVVGRELKMIELKKEINALCKKQGKPQPYPVAQSQGAS